MDQFRRDQRQEHYAEILQQATRLDNATDFSSSAIAAGGYNRGFGNYYEGGTTYSYYYNGTYHSSPPTTGSSDRQYDNTYVEPNQVPGGRWQDAYTALDQAISNAEIAGRDTTINLARALRDKYRNDYYESVSKNVDTLINQYPDPKPNRDQMINAIVGVPDKSASASYPIEYKSKSTDELTKMYVESAGDDLELNDH